MEHESQTVKQHNNTPSTIRPVISSSVTVTTRRNLLEFIDTEYQAGRFKLPSEMALAEALHVSRISLREVIKELAQEGVIYSLHGKGTYINCNYKSLKVKLTPAVEFEQAINACGYTASVEVLSVTLHTPDPLTAQELDLKKGDQIYIVHKVFFADGMPVIFCEDIFPLSLLQGHSLTKEEIKASTFDVLLAQGGVQVASDIADLLACTTEDLRNFKPYSIKEKPLALLQLHSVYYTLRQVPILKVNAYFDTRYIRLSMLRRQDVYSSGLNNENQVN
ncbi:transcriptional regulator [Sphaerochaeta pleomorpha str. Grapes]|uniref:Transcriptional regulator n=1 Tax=Sphaerochaeta pleomorpha (strain ATCC BAA-1885 / DSM 22778 / Grapes) TaxID=158190 RepID=G8QXL4_SPHPG|nr:GntR family transcriptional regulator [Sphaerochaeta pleomorpha]AEV29577.1 transcriptional regulator [Sphaerochaeta pleomorpha str. Grapes]